VSERQRVALACEECGARNYKKTKPRSTDLGRPQERLELKKYCPRERQHTSHKESRKK
jgi:large subunit ribosomal protein L33